MTIRLTILPTKCECLQFAFKQTSWYPANDRSVEGKQCAIIDVRSVRIVASNVQCAILCNARSFSLSFDFDEATRATLLSLPVEQILVCVCGTRGSGQCAASLRWWSHTSWRPGSLNRVHMAAYGATRAEYGIRN